MKTKIIQFIPTLFVLMIIGFSYFSQQCVGTAHSCYWTVVDKMIPYITYPAYFFTLYSLPLTIILILVRRDIFNSWLKLALWAVPLSIVFIANTDVTSGGAYFVLYSFYRDDAARFAAIIFSIISLALIGWKYFKTRNIRTS